ncbi:hypothetical protein VTN77DRAFT_3183 [Rasamsonia byssochlamydoides]|uniref:uncharacterized protein n=1 Tax=Rasamsonia byssochlamydoides TaxID=89139 RepID=UPI003743DBE9
MISGFERTRLLEDRIQELEAIVSLSLEASRSSFDTMTMSYLESPPGFRNIQGTDYLNTMPGMDLPDQRVNVDIETFIRCVPLGFFPNFGSSGGCVSFGTGPPGRIMSPAALPSGRVTSWRGQKPTEHCRAHTHTHIPGVRLCSRRSCDFGSTAKVCVEFVRGIQRRSSDTEGNASIDSKPWKRSRTSNWHGSDLQDDPSPPPTAHSVFVKTARLVNAPSRGRSLMSYTKETVSIQRPSVLGDHPPAETLVTGLQAMTIPLSLIQTL